MTYDAIDPPGFVESREVAPGVHWIRLPMPFRLDHINVWAIEDDDGWVLVDTGLRTEDTVATWQTLMERAPFCRPLKMVLVTHMHPDHIGMAGWFTRRFGVPLWMTRAEYFECRALVSDTGREAPEDAVRFYEQAGWGLTALETYRASFGDFGRYIHALPDSYVRLFDGQMLSIGGRTWEVVVGYGHSPEHACLYCQSLKLFISGDQVLPWISSNVSVFPTEPLADPMAAWFKSLEQIEDRVPDDVLVLPSHNDCFHGLHARLRHLRTGQLEAMMRLREHLKEARRVVDVFPVLFRRPINEADFSHLGLATGEAVACLNSLIHAGEVIREVRYGVAWFKLAGLPSR